MDTFLDLVSAAGAHFEHIIDFFARHAVTVADVAVGTGKGEHLAAEFGDFERRAPRDIAEARETESLARDVLAAVVEHFLEEIGGAEARRFGTDERAAVGQTFARQHAVFVDARQFLVCAEEIADFSAAHAHVARGNIYAGADVAVEFVHETVAEAHDFVVGFARGIEVAAALSAAHRQAGERVLESLLERQEFHHRKVDIGLETQAAFVGSDSVVELHAESAVDMIDAFVILPRHAEDNLPVGFGHSFEDAVFAQHLFVVFDGRGEGNENFLHGLHKFGFTRIFQSCCFDDFRNVRHKFLPIEMRPFGRFVLRKLYSRAKNKSRVNYLFENDAKKSTRKPCERKSFAARDIK